MKRNEINKEDLLQTAWDIVFQEGLDKLSIRYLAKQADVAIGSVYNYFPSKDELVLEIVENYWKSVFYEEICQVNHDTSYINFVRELYNKIARHNDEFQHYFLSHLRILNQKTLQLLKEKHLYYVDHTKQGLLKILEKDHTINTNVWSDVMTMEKYVLFTLDLMMVALSRGQTNFDFESIILKRAIGEKL